MSDDLYGFKMGQEVEWRCSFRDLIPPMRGCVLGLASGEGRLLIEVRRKGRRYEVAAHPAHLRPVAC